MLPCFSEATRGHGLPKHNSAWGKGTTCGHPQSTSTCQRRAFNQTLPWGKAFDIASSAACSWPIYFLWLFLVFLVPQKMGPLQVFQQLLGTPRMWTCLLLKWSSILESSPETRGVRTGFQVSYGSNKCQLHGQLRQFLAEREWPYEAPGATKL